MINRLCHAQRDLVQMPMLMALLILLMLLSMLILQRIYPPPMSRSTRTSKLCANADGVADIVDVDDVDVVDQVDIAEN